MIKKAKVIIGSLVLIFIIGSTATFLHFKNKFLSAPTNMLSLTTTGEPFDFIWVQQDINVTIEPHAAIMVPVTIPGVDQVFHMQFDTGAHSTVLYYNAVKSINEKYGLVFSTKQDDDTYWVENITLNVGTVNLTATSMSYRGMGAAINWDNLPPIIKIGTIGSDFMEKHVLSIDYANQQITLSESSPVPANAGLTFAPFTFDGRKVFLSGTFNDEKVSMWFDTGSSTFEMIVDEGTFNQLATAGASTETLTLNSWGTKVTAYNQAAEGMFNFAGTDVPLSFVSYIDWPNKLQAWTMKASSLSGDLGGMTGNRLFLDKKLILDTPNLRYALVP